MQRMELHSFLDKAYIQLLPSHAPHLRSQECGRNVQLWQTQCNKQPSLIVSTRWCHIDPASSAHSQVSVLLGFLPSFISLYSFMLRWWWVPGASSSIAALKLLNQIWTYWERANSFKHDAVEAHSCVKTVIANNSRARRNWIHWITQFQHILTQRSLSTVCRNACLTVLKDIVRTIRTYIDLLQRPLWPQSVLSLIQPVSN